MTSTQEQFRSLLREQPVLPSPMCGISDYAFRSICREHGAAFTYTQMVSAEGMVRNDARSIEVLDIDPRGQEPSVGMQLFGCDPEKLAESARQLEAWGAVVVDLNLGCPAKKVVGQMGGSALLRHPELVQRIFTAIRRVVSVPFTAKLRWDYEEMNGAALEIGRIAEGEGLDGLCLHARTKEQGYSGAADWDQIKRLKDSVGMPVVGNGDVRSPEDAAAMIAQTGCDGVMIGRAAIGDPWLIGRAIDYVKGRGLEADPSDEWQERRRVMIEHARRMVERKGRRGLVEFRKHAVAYLRGQRGAKAMRPLLMKVERIEDLEELLNSPVERWAETGAEI